MQHADHVALLEGKPGLREQAGAPIRGAGGAWADLGAGSGAFTLALVDLLDSGASIYAVDREVRALNQLQRSVQAHASGQFAAKVSVLHADFTRPLPLPVLDGVVMANSLHYLPDRDKPGFLNRLREMIRPGGQLTIVEYNTDRGNMWVPHPFSYQTWEKLAANSGYAKVAWLNSRPSRFLGEIYAAVAVT
ncbi:MAG: class I SAM-dependent methyltransferase [Chloroflexi bacterium]|nr:class I SAM-dependent methyltransferase [Chloroflexota bacterium]